MVPVPTALAHTQCRPVPLRLLAAPKDPLITCRGMHWSLLACNQHVLAFGGVEAEMVLIHPVVDCIN